jgi:hypothetical protein
MCALALGATYLQEQPLGNGPGELSPGLYYGMLVATAFCYNTQLLALEISIYTYIATFLTYNADVGFSAKIASEAAGFMLVFGLVNVLSTREMTYVLLGFSVPAFLLYFILFKPPPTPAALVDHVETEPEK